MKTLVRNAVGDKVLNNYLPMTSANAEAFADKYFDGTWKIYEGLSSVDDNKADAIAYDMSVQVSDTSTGKKSYLNMIVKSTKNETDVRTALIGLTIDGILVDKVAIIKIVPLSFA